MLIRACSNKRRSHIRRNSLQNYTHTACSYEHARTAISPTVASHSLEHSVLKHKVRSHIRCRLTLTRQKSYSWVKVPSPSPPRVLPPFFAHIRARSSLRARPAPVCGGGARSASCGFRRPCARAKDARAWGPRYAVRPPPLAAQKTGPVTASGK